MKRIWTVGLYISLGIITLGVIGDVGYRLAGTPYILGRYIAIWLLLIGSLMGLFIVAIQLLEIHR